MKSINGEKVHVYRPMTFLHSSLAGEGRILRKGLFCSLVVVKTSYWDVYRVSNKWIFADDDQEY